MLKTSVIVLVLAHVSAPFAAIAQVDRAPSDSDVERRIVETIQEIEARGPPNSAELIEPLTTLGMRYQEAGNHDLAAPTIRRALQVVRANRGLSTLDQAPLIRLSIDIEEARGDAAAAWELEQELLDLVRAHPGDLATVPILRDIGDKRMDLMRRYMVGGVAPEILLGCFYRLPDHLMGSCHAGSRRAAIRSILAAAHESYLDAIDVLTSQGLYSNDELRDLETELVRSIYLYGRPRNTSSGYERGRERLSRLLDYEIESAAPISSRIAAFVRIADWDLLYRRHGAALQAYEQALEELRQEGVPQGAIETIFAPSIPLVLPTFLPNPLEPDSAQDSAGHIDVAFEITRFGRSRRIETLATENASREDVDDLLQLLRQSRFRPRLVAGRLDDTPRIVVRYRLPR